MHYYPVEKKKKKEEKKKSGSGGIRTHAIEMTGALNQRLRPLGHATTTATTAQQFIFILTTEQPIRSATMEREVTSKVEAPAPNSIIAPYIM